MGFNKFQLARMLSIMPDKLYLTILYLIRMKKPLHWKKPETYTEKIQWLKINDPNRKSYAAFVDKYAVKAYIEKTAGKKYVIPVLGVWDKAEEIDLSGFPEQFVLKCTHDSGSVILCRDKSKLDIDAVRKRLREAQKQNLFWLSRETPYKYVKPRIIAEQYIGPPDAVGGGYGI